MYIYICQGTKHPFLHSHNPHIPLYFLRTKFNYKNGFSLILQPYNKINNSIYFKNLTIGLYILHTLNIHIKFCVN